MTESQAHALGVLLSESRGEVTVYDYDGITQVYGRAGHSRICLDGTIVRLARSLRFPGDD